MTSDWYEEHQSVNRLHEREPKMGDYWHEMFCPFVVVINVLETEVVICESIMPVGPDHWTWDLSKIRKVPIAEFSQMLHYKSEAMKDKFIYDVVPEAHSFVREACIKELGLDG